jgi:glycosyltransferase involved in cell wall biosynthesis
MVAVHQFLTSLAPRDAQSQHHLHIRDALRGAGFESDLYVAEAKGELRNLARPFRTFEGGPGVWLLYGHAIGSPVADFVNSRAEPLLLDYHNITPPEFFEGWEPHAAIRMAAGRRQLAPLAARCRLGLADSEFNAAELRDAGARRTAVVPIMVDTANFVASPDAMVVDRLAVSRAAGRAQLLFVGRLAPNKCQHDLVAAIAALRAGYGIEASLHLVGGSASDRYERALRCYARESGVGHLVHLAGSVTPSELAAYYEGADAYVCLSEHEGFCVPLLEAWYHGVPVIAYASTAVPETLGDSGVLLQRKSPTRVAAAVARVLDDVVLRTRLADLGHARLDRFDPARSRAALLAAVGGVVDGG